MDYRRIDSAINKFGFRLQYNRLFKPEYLPGRVKYNQFFFMLIASLGYGYFRANVSLSPVLTDLIILTGSALQLHG